MNRVAVTGMGIIDTLGASPTECFDSMLDTSYINPPLFSHSQLERHKTQPVFPVDKSKLILPELKPTILKNLEPCNLFALHTIEHALEQSGCSAVTVAVRRDKRGHLLRREQWPRPRRGGLHLGAAGTSTIVRVISGPRSEPHGHTAAGQLYTGPSKGDLVVHVRPPRRIL